MGVSLGIAYGAAGRCFSVGRSPGGAGVGVQQSPAKAPSRGDASVGSRLPGLRGLCPGCFRKKRWPRTPVSVRVSLHCAPSLPSLPHGPGPSKAEAVFVTFLFREREAWTGTFEVPGKWIELAPKTFEFALCEPHRRAALPPEPSNTGSSGTSSYVELTGFARPGYLLARCSSVLPAGEDGCVTMPRLGRQPPRSRAFTASSGMEPLTASGSARGTSRGKARGWQAERRVPTLSQRDPLVPPRGRVSLKMGSRSGSLPLPMGGHRI